MSKATVEILNDQDYLTVRDAHLLRAGKIFRGEAVKPVFTMSHTLFPIAGDGSVDGIHLLKDPELWVRGVLEHLASVAGDASDETTLRLLVVNCIAPLFSARFMDKLFGAEVWYDGDKWVANELPTDVGTLACPDLDKHAAFIGLERAMREFVKADVKLPCFMPPAFAGSLNTAVNLYGSRFLEAIYDDPERVRHDLRVITDLTVDIYRRIARVVPRAQLLYYSSALPGYGMLSGCTTQMISAAMFRDAFLPFEEEVYAAFPGDYLFHICGSSTQHISAFREMKKLRGVEVSNNKHRWEDFVQYYQGLRDDQVVLFSPPITTETTAEMLNKIEYLTAGRRIIVYGDLSEKPPADAGSRSALSRGHLLSDIRTGWLFKIDATNRGEQERWFLNKPDVQWRPIAIDRPWTQQGYDYHGTAWYSVAVPPVAPVDPADRLYLVFRSVDGDAAVWIDGIKVGEQCAPPVFMWNRAWGLDVTDQVTKADRGFQLTIKVTKDQWAAGIWKPVELRSDAR